MPLSWDLSWLGGPLVSAYPNATVKEIWKALDVDKAFQQVLDNPASKQALESPAMKPLLDRAAA
jgi:hypothetical protein